MDEESMYRTAAGESIVNVNMRFFEDGRWTIKQKGS
jgi:hypothetical protein